MKYRWFLVSIAVLVAVSIAVACTPQQRPVEPSPTNPQRQPDMTPNRDINMTPNTVSGADDAMADAIADEVEDIKGIEDAVVIVSGNTAYIGIDLDRNVEGSLTDKLKNEVIKKAKNVDVSKAKVKPTSAITRVYVSADMDTVERLRGYARDIRNGRPFSGLRDQINEMFNRSAPSVH